VPSRRFLQDHQNRLIYQDPTLHSQIILLLVCLVLDQAGRLDPAYCDQFPNTAGKVNVLFILQNHLNHPANDGLLPGLTSKAARARPDGAAVRLLKLLCAGLSKVSRYERWTKIAAGAYGVIYRAECEGQRVAIKQMGLPKSQYDRCVVHDVYNEVHILEHLRLSDASLEIFDYGLSEFGYFMVVKEYRGSLREWRLSQKEVGLPAALELFRKVIECIKRVHTCRVTHYDLKADNVLLDDQEASRAKVVLADFGEAKIYSDERDELDVKNRGTDCIKSP
jgi:serine/threonine protein kinase